MNGFGGMVQEEIIRNLQVTTKEAFRLEISLRFNGKSVEANTVAAKASELSQQLDVLLQEPAYHAVEPPEKIVVDIAQANASLQSSISQIETGVAIAENAVKAIGCVDDVLVIATKITKTG